MKAAARNTKPFAPLLKIPGLLKGLVLLVFPIVTFSGCAGRPVVKGLFEPGGTIYREPEQEEWGSRSTLKVRGLEF